MSVTVQPRTEAPKTLAAAVQAQKPNDVTGQRQPNTVETTPPPAEATPPAEKKDDFLSPKFAALARQEKQIRIERQRLKDEKAAFEAEKSARLNGYIPKDKLKKDPLSAFEDAGLTYDELTQTIINAPQGQVDPTMRAAQAKIAELESKINALTQKTEETQTTAYKQAVETIRREVSGIVDSKPEEFELIKALGQTEAVVALIEETFKADGYQMNVMEAAKEVEEHLIEEATRMAGLEKVKKKLAPATAEVEPTPQSTQPAQEKQPTTQQQQLRTLSNSVQATAPRRLTERERRERAILAAQGKLTN